MALAILDGNIDQFGVFGLLASGEDQAGISCGILRLVLVDGSEIAAVADNSGAGGLQLIERGCHVGCMNFGVFRYGFEVDDQFCWEGFNLGKIYSVGVPHVGDEILKSGCWALGMSGRAGSLITCRKR